MYFRKEKKLENTDLFAPKQFKTYNETLPNLINKRFIESETKK